MQAFRAPLLRWGLPAAAAAPWAAFTVALTGAAVHVVAACFALRFAAALVPASLRPATPRVRLATGVAVSLFALAVALVESSTASRLVASGLAGLAATLSSSAIVDGYKDAAGPASVPLTAAARFAGALAGVLFPPAVLPAVLLAAAAAACPAPACALACRACVPWSPRRAVTPPFVVLAAVVLVGTAPVLAYGIVAPEIVTLASALGALVAACVSHRGALLHLRDAHVRVDGLHARHAAPACALAGLAACTWSLSLPLAFHLLAVVLAGASLELARHAVLASARPGTVFARLFLAASGLSSLAALAFVTFSPAYAAVLAGTLTALAALAHLALTHTPSRA